MSNKNEIVTPKDKTAGIYMLYNVTNHKAYIGKTQNFRSRAMQHNSQLLNGTHSNKEMQRDFDNQDEFLFVILERVGEDCTKEMLNFKERQYIYIFSDWLKTYNHETMKQLKDLIFFDMIGPVSKEISRNFRAKFGCYVPTLRMCSADTLKTKFRQDETMERDKERKE